MISLNFALLNNNYIMTNRTFTMIKPDAFAAGHSGAILNHILTAGYRLVALKMVHLSKQSAGQFYAVHKERPFYGELVEYMTSGPVFISVLEGENAVAEHRKIMGATDPKKADAGTIRADFAESIQANCVHGSDSLENAKIEIAQFFPEVILKAV